MPQKKKKKLWIFLGCLVGLLAGIYIILVFFIGSFVTKAVNRYGPGLTQTNLTLTAAHISPFSGEGTLDNLVVGNPAGWGSDKAFSLKKIHVKAVPKSLFTDHIILNDLEIDGPEFVYKTKFVSSNVGDLLKSIQRHKGNSANDVKDKSGRTIRFEIQHVLVKEGKITLEVAGGPSVNLDMPEIELHNLGGNGQGITSTELAELVMQTMVTTVAQASAKGLLKIPGAATGTATDILKGAGQSVEGLFKH